MLQKCANPGCSNQFRLLHQGKLFELEIQYVERTTGDDDHEIGKNKGQIERYWLCDKCAAHATLRFDRELGLALNSPVDLKDVAIPLSNGRDPSEISRLRSRPLDLNFNSRRDMTSVLKARRQAA